MTALCGGGTSAPKIGVDLAVAYSAGRLAQLLVAAGLSELSAWLPLVGLIPVVTVGFCGSDPPAMVALTQAESDALANNTFGADFVNGLGKFKDVLLNIIWGDLCHCTSGTYAPSTIPPIDANTPVFIPPTPQPSVPCFQLTPTPAHPVAGTTGPFLINDFFQGRPVTSLKLDLVASVFSGAGASATLHIAQLQTVPSSVVLSNTSHPITPTGTFSFIENVNPLCGLVQIFSDVPTGGGTDTWNFTYTTWCGTTPGGLQSPCCPPDPATQSYLDLILKAITLVQRQAVPFGYVTSTVHSTLSGAGTISISGLIGASVECTTIPASYGRAGTTPTEYFDMGFLTFGTADGYPTAYRLDRQSKLMLPTRCGAYTELDYDLAPGVVVTITELLREP